MASGDLENVPPVSVSLDITIRLAIEKTKAAYSMLENANHFISSSFASDPSFRPNPKTSFSFLITLYNMLEQAEDVLNTSSMKVNTGTMEMGDSENIPTIPTLDDPASIKALLRLNTASSRIHKALQFIHPKITSPKPFRLSTGSSVAFLEALYSKVGEAITILTIRLVELTAADSPSKWRRMKRSFSQFRKSITRPFRSCFGSSSNAQN